MPHWFALNRAHIFYVHGLVESYLPPINKPAGNLSQL